MPEPTSSHVRGVGFLGTLALIFITLKLAGVINWSWWWVLAPLWVVPAICLGVFAVLGAIGIVLVLFGKRP